jgi:hypothetical protein
VRRQASTRTGDLGMIRDDSRTEGAGCQRHARSARTRGGRTPRQASLAAALRCGALAAAVTLLGACTGGGHGAAHASESSAPGAPPASAQGRNGTEGQPSGLSAEVLYYFVPATGPQYSLGAKFSGTYSALRDDIIAACMARSGFRVPRISAAIYTAQDFDNDQWPDLAAISRSGTLDPGLRYGLRQLIIPRSEQHAYQADFSRCQQDPQKIIAPLMRAGNNLARPWLSIVNRIQVSTQIRGYLDHFSSCVEQAGTPGSSAGSFSYFLAWVTGLETAAKTKASAIAVDRHWAPIFVRCAGPAVAVQDRLELAQQAAFLQQHGQQVRALQVLAARVVTRLKRQYGTM